MTYEKFTLFEARHHTLLIHQNIDSRNPRKRIADSIEKI